MTTPIRLVIDTDVGTDVDDLWTLAMVPTFPHVTLEAVTCVYGDTDLRARLAAVALAGMGIDVPIHRGREVPMSGKDVMWAGHEGDGVDGIDTATYASGDAVDVLVEAAARAPGTLDVVAIGPLTNIAAAIEADPAFATNLRRLTLMGGAFASGWPEHNFSADAVATEKVLDCGAPITVMPLDQTLRIMLNRADATAMAAVHPIGDLMLQQAETFWIWFASIVPGSKGDASPAHDPAALLTVLAPDLFETTAMSVRRADPDVLDGRFLGEPDMTSNIDVVTDFDPTAVHTALMASYGVT